MRKQQSNTIVDLQPVLNTDHVVIVLSLYSRSWVELVKHWRKPTLQTQHETYHTVAEKFNMLVKFSSHRFRAILIKIQL